MTSYPWMSARLIGKHALYDYMQIRLEAELIIRLQMRPPKIKRCLLSTLNTKINSTVH